jgi:phage terminase small subunit
VAKKPTLKLIAADAGLPQPPAHLGEAGLELWRSIQASYAIDDPGGVALLTVAAESADRVASCRTQLNEAGEVIVVKGVPRAHPAAAIERDARAALIRALKALNLDVEPLRDRPGRPSGSRW